MAAAFLASNAGGMASGTIGIGKDVIGLLEQRKGSASARSVQFRIMNFTASTLTLTHDQCTGGEYTTDLKPPATIGPNAQSGFMAESHGFMTGTEGYARYAIGDGNTSTESLKINWNNPYVGDNTVNANIEGGSTYQCTLEGGKGNNCSLSVKVTGGPAPKAPEPAPEAAKPAVDPAVAAAAGGVAGLGLGAGAAAAADGENPEEGAQQDGENYGEDGAQPEDGDVPYEEGAEGEAQDGDVPYEGEEGAAEGENYGEEQGQDEQPQDEQYGEEQPQEEQYSDEQAQEEQPQEEQYGEEGAQRNEEEYQ